ncbi:hypothetical protein AMECASPLE_004807, partial [Ameca splendens]
QSYPLALSGSPCLSHNACEASLRGRPVCSVRSTQKLNSCHFAFNKGDVERPWEDC